jgi:hypothetical protein
MFRIRTFVREIAATIKDVPERWKAGTYTLERDDGIQLWIGNGRGSIHLYKPHDVKFYFRERILLWKLYENWLSKSLFTNKEQNRFGTRTVGERLDNLETDLQRAHDRISELIQRLAERAAMNPIIPNPRTTYPPTYPAPTLAPTVEIDRERERAQSDMARILNAPLIAGALLMEFNQQQGLPPLNDLSDAKPSATEPEPIPEIYFDETPDDRKGS